MPEQDGEAKRPGCKTHLRETVWPWLHACHRPMPVISLDRTKTKAVAGAASSIIFAQEKNGTRCITVLQFTTLRDSAFLARQVLGATIFSNAVIRFTNSAIVGALKVDFALGLDVCVRQNHETPVLGQ